MGLFRPAGGAKLAAGAPHRTGQTSSCRLAIVGQQIITKGKQTMNEYDWDSELKIHRNGDNVVWMWSYEIARNRKLHAAEQWRWAKAARPARVRMTSGKLLGLATAAASRSAAAAGQVVGAVHAWVAGSSEPREECC